MTNARPPWRRTPVRTRANTRSLTALIVCTYVVFVLTRRGQQFDNNAKLFASLHHYSVGLNRYHSVLAWRRASFYGARLFGVALVGAFATWGRTRIRSIALPISAVVLLPVLVSEVAKRVLPRPHLSSLPSWIGGPTFPSGHTTFAASTAIAIAILAPQGSRKLVCALGTAGTFAMMLLVVADARHRPSDAMAGSLVALLSTSFLARRWNHAPRDHQTSALVNPSPETLGRSINNRRVLIGVAVLSAIAGIVVMATTREQSGIPNLASANRALLGTVLLVFALSVYFYQCALALAEQYASAP